MSKKFAYLVAGGALVALLQWAVPAAYSAVVAEDEAVQTCPVGGSCPISQQGAEAEA